MKGTQDREKHRLRRHGVSDLNTDTCYYVGEINELCQYCQSLSHSVDRYESESPSK